MRASHCSELRCAKPYYYNAKPSTTTIHPDGASESRKIKLPARTRGQSVCRCQIYGLRVCPTLTSLVDEFVAKFLRQNSLDEFLPIQPAYLSTITRGKRRNYAFLGFGQLGSVAPEPTKRLPGLPKLQPRRLEVESAAFV